MTRKLKSETSSQKIDVSADIIPGSLTLLTGFVILDLVITFPENQLTTSGLSIIMHVVISLPDARRH